MGIAPDRQEKTLNLKSKQKQQFICCFFTLGVDSVTKEDKLSGIDVAVKSGNFIENF